MPMKVRPYIDFSPQTPKRSSDAAGLVREQDHAEAVLGAERSWLFTLSLEMPSTTVFAASNRRAAP